MYFANRGEGERKKTSKLKAKDAEKNKKMQ